MRRLGILILAITCYTVGLQAQQLNDSLFEITNLDTIKLVQVQQNKASSLGLASQSTELFLFIFLSPECPLSQYYTPALNNLEKEYQQRVAIIGIVPGRSYTRKTIAAFIKKYGIHFPVFIDKHKNLTGYLLGTVTPEVILLDRNMNLVYKGAIDDRVQELGQNRIVARESYLKNAIELSLLKKEIVKKRTNPVGCLINDY